MTNEQLSQFAKRSFDAGNSYTDSASVLTSEDREGFREIWDEATQPQGLGEAMGRAMGGRYQVGSFEVPVIPKNFIDSVGRMMQGMGEFALGVAEPENWKLTKDLVEVVIDEALSDGPSPVTDEIARVLGEDVFYFTDKQNLYNKIAEEPAEVVSDIAAAVAAVATGGVSIAGRVGTKSPKLLQLLAQAKRAAEIADPSMLPSHGIRGITRGAGGVASPPSARRFDETQEFRVGDETQTITPREGAERFGAGVEDTPDSVLNPSDVVSRREFQERAVQSGEGQRKLEATQAATTAHREGMTGDVNVSLEDTGQRVIQGYQEKALEDSMNFRQIFQQIRAQFDEVVPAYTRQGDRFESYEWRKNLDAAIDTLRPTQVDPKERQAVIGVVEDILQDVDTRALKLSDIDAFRTEFRQRMMGAFRQGEINGVGSGTMTEKVYNAITEDLYDAIEATVDASDGRLPATLLDEVKAAKTAYRERKVLEETAGGRFLLSRANQDDPSKFVQGLLTRLDTAEIQNVYKLIGTEAADDIQAGLLLRIFQNAKGPQGLNRELMKINERNPNRLIELFGGEARGKSIAEELGALGAFEAMSAEATRLAKGSPTGQVNRQLLERLESTGAASTALYTMWELGDLVVRGNDFGMAGTIAGTLFGGWLVRKGAGKMMSSDLNTYRLVQGLLPPESIDTFIAGVERATGQPVAKPIEISGRFQDGLTIETTEKE